MDPQDVTILIVPRDHFGHARASLESLRVTAPEGVHWVYVDAASPRRVRRWLEQQAAEDERFTLIRYDGFLPPNVTRNIGLEHCRTPWLVFVDNDVFGTPGWLETLMRCADETRADGVNPVVCIGGELHRDIHLAGGYARIEEREDGRYFVESHGFPKKRLADARPKMERGPLTIVEYHCLLLRREAVAAVEPLDERLTATREHLDLGLQLLQSGAKLWFEPDSVVTYLSPPPYSRGDRRHFLLRWSNKLAQESTDWFYDKWDLVRDEKYGKWNSVYLWRRRRRAMEPWATLTQKILGRKLGKRFLKRTEKRIVRRQLRRWKARAAASRDGRAPVDDLRRR
jgi:GT2 family glycosyltransferase